MIQPEDVDFGFPFQPYHIQESFMKKVFDVLSNEQFGIFESRKFHIVINCEVKEAQTELFYRICLAFCMFL